MPEFVRVKNKVTGAEYTKPKVAVRSDSEQVLDKPAVDRNGDALRAKTDQLKKNPPSSAPKPEGTATPANSNKAK